MDTIRCRHTTRAAPRDRETSPTIRIHEPGRFWIGSTLTTTLRRTPAPDITSWKTVLYSAAFRDLHKSVVIFVKRSRLDPKCDILNTKKKTKLIAKVVLFVRSLRLSFLSPISSFYIRCMISKKIIHFLRKQKKDLYC